MLQAPGSRGKPLTGEWKGYRSSRLNLQYRVIYGVDKEKILVLVENVTPHDYRRKQHEVLSKGDKGG